MRYVSMALLAMIAATALVEAPRALAALPATCEGYVGPECGGAAGDALCGSGEVCQDTGNGCECQRTACCRCEPVAGTDSASCTQPCEDATLNTLSCAGQCVTADSEGATCNLTVMVDKSCTGNTCNPTGCCTVNVSLDPMVPETVLCVTTDAFTCETAPEGMPGVFVAGGHCAGGVFGQCVPGLPDGDTCASPSECGSGFCADGVCCNTACDGPDQECNLSGEVGTCASTVAPAPALDGQALFFAVTLLSGIAALALRRRTRTPATAAVKGQRPLQ